MSDVKQTCVQCGGTFTDAANKEGECAFHGGPYNSWQKKRPCCDGAAPCVRKPHRAKHHCEYAYEAFFARAQDILGYTDTLDEWGEAKALDLDSGKEQLASVGQLLRWKSRGAYVGETQPLVCVRVGSVWFGQRYFFHTFDPIELDAVGRQAQSSLVPLFRTNPESSAYASAAWLVEAQLVVGVRLEAKAATDERATVVDVRFSAVPPLAKQGVAVVQRGGIVERRLAAPHALPAASDNGGAAAVCDLDRVHVPAPRDDFRTRDAVTRKQLLSLQLAAPLACNEHTVQNGRDRFEFRLQVVNTGAEPVMLLKLGAEFKLLNDAAWQPAAALDFGRHQQPLPLTVGALGSAELAGVVVAPFRDAADAERRPWFYRSYLARHRPVRFRFTLTDAAGRELSRVFEYTSKLPRLEQRRDSDALFLALDDVDELERHVCRVQLKDDSDTLADLDGTSFDIKAARKAVHQAKQTGKSEIALDAVGKDNDAYATRFFALVDRAADAVYAIKAQIIHKRTGSAKQAYAPLRFYGDADAAETIAVGVAAVEEAQLTHTVAAVAASPFDFDDKGLDDLSLADIEFPQEAAIPPAASAPNSIDLSRLESKLDKLNATMERIAVAIEKLTNK